MSDINNTTISRQGRVVANAQRDTSEIYFRKKSNVSKNKSGNNVLYNNANLSDENFTVHAGEVCLRNKQVLCKRNMADTDIKVFSSMNGAYVKKENGRTVDESEESIRLRKRKRLDFAGIADTRSTHSSDNLRNQLDCVQLMGGARTIVNTGTQDLQVGDVVLWDLPTKNDHDNRPQIRGIPKDKVLIQTEKYCSSDKPNLKSMKKILGIYKNSDLKLPQKGALPTDTPNEYLASSLRDLILLSASYGAAIASSKGARDVNHFANEFGLFNNSKEQEGEFSKDKEILKYVCDPTEDNIAPEKQLAKIQKNCITSTMVAFQEGHNEINRRIIGKAISNGKVGHEFDILVGRFIA